MNDLFVEKKISSYEELQTEKQKLQEHIVIQKLIIRNDLEEISEVLKIKAQPIARATNWIQQFTTRETRSNALIYSATNVMVDAITRKLFGRSNVLLQLVLPPLLKNISSHLVFSALRKNDQRKAAKAHAGTL